jgi:hypothetical protein
MEDMKNSTMPPLIVEAHQASEENRLIPWVIDHLSKEEKNASLIKHLREDRNVTTLLLDYPLERLKRIEGVQNNEEAIEHVDEWTNRVKDFEQAFKNGYVSPPLLVTDFWNKIEIADGNHRHEALLNSGYKRYWTIFLFTKKESIQRILKTHIRKKE